MCTTTNSPEIKYRSSYAVVRRDGLRGALVCAGVHRRRQHRLKAPRACAYALCVRARAGRAAVIVVRWDGLRGALVCARTRCVALRWTLMRCVLVLCVLVLCVWSARALCLRGVVVQFVVIGAVIDRSSPSLPASPSSSPPMTWRLDMLQLVPMFLDDFLTTPSPSACMMHARYCICPVHAPCLAL